jgi:hypothetical protein
MRAAELCQQHKITNAELLTIRGEGEPDILAMIMNTTIDKCRDGMSSDFIVLPKWKASLLLRIRVDEQHQRSG